MRRAIPVLGFMILVASALPAMGASPTYSAGTIVGPADLDVVPQLTALKAQPCYRDSDGDGSYDPGEPIYLDLVEAVCTVNLRAGDLRLTPSGSFPAGSVVRPTDADFDERLETDIVGATFVYRDLAADGAWGPGDGLTLDLDGDTSVEPGDLRLTAAGTKAAGTIVGLSDTDLLSPAAASPFADANVYMWNRTGTAAYDVGDLLVLDADKDGLAERGDVLLTPYGPHGFGTIVDATHFLPVPQLKSATAAWCFLDEDGDAAYDQEETVLLDLVDGNCSRGSDVTDLRLTRSGAGHDYAPFTMFSTADDDFNDNVHNLTDAKVRFRDFASVPGTAFEGGGADTLYLDVNGDGVITLGDVRLTTHELYGAGTWVTPSDSDGGLALRSTPFTKDDVAYWDANGNNAPDVGEPIHLDADDDGLIEPNDVRLTSVPGPLLDGIMPASDAAPPPSEPDAPTEPTTPTEPNQPTTPTDGFDEGDAEENGSPGLGAVGLAGATVAAFLLRRRR